MKILPKVKKILNSFDSENAGVLKNLAQLFNHGKTATSGKLMLLSVSEGLKKGPAYIYNNHPSTYNPHFHFQIASDAELSGLIAPIGVIETGARFFAGEIPLILEVNTNTSLNTERIAPTTALTSNVKDALRLGCVGICYNLYPGSDRANENYEDFREIAREAKDNGLFVMTNIEPRGGFISLEGENSLDILSYGVHIAANLGANIINCNIPTDYVEQPKAKRIYKDVSKRDKSDRLKHIVESAFSGNKIVTFNSSNKIDYKDISDETKCIKDANANGVVFSTETLMQEYNSVINYFDQISKLYIGQ